MKTIEELKQFYDTTLSQELVHLEAKRKAIIRKAITIFVVSLIVLGLICWRINPACFVIPIIISLIAWGLANNFLSRDYAKEFKADVIQKIVRFVDENLQYSSNNCIPESTYALSQIFKVHVDRYHGDDLFTGKVGVTNIQFSEVHSEYKTHDKNGTHWHTIFKGLFFVGDFNKDFAGTTVILPDFAENLFGKFGQMLQSLNSSMGQLIKLEDPEFEKLFAVYGSDQVEARYILSTSLMKRIVDFKKKTNKQIYLSFVGSLVFVAVRYGKNLFEPRLFQTLLDFEPVRQYFEDIELAVGIVDDLNLNTRIWSKQ
jgi:hypothetical protein